MIAVFTCINSWKHASEERHKKSNNAAIAILVFTTLLQVGSFYSGFTAINEKNISDNLTIVKEKENKALGDSLKIFQSKIISLQNNLLDTTNKILFASLNLNQQQKKLNQQQQKSNQLQQKLNQLQYEVYSQVIGSDKGPTLDVSICKKTPNDIGLDLFNHVKYPTFDIRVNVTVLSYLRDFQPMNYDGRINAKSEPTEFINLGTLLPGQAYLGFMTTRLDSNIKSLTWGINLSWRNGSSHFVIIFERNNNGIMVTKSFKRSGI